MDKTKAAAPDDGAIAPIADERFAAILRQAPAPILHCDADGVINFANRACAELLGLPAESLIGKRVADVLPEPAPGKTTKHTLPDGTSLHLNVSEASLNGGKIYLLQRASETDASQNEVLQEFLQSAGMPMHWISEDGIIVWANKAQFDLLGYTAEEYIGKHISNFHVEKGNTDDLERRFAAGEQLLDHPAVLICKDGTEKHVEITSHAFTRNGEYIDARSFKDVTATRIKEDRYRFLFENTPDAVFIGDGSGVYLDVNEAAAAILGYPREELIGKEYAKFIPPGLSDYIQEIREKLKEDGKWEGEFPMIRKDGSIAIMEYRTTLDRSTGSILGVARDVTSRKKVEENLRRSEERFRLALSSGAVTVYQQDKDLRYLWVYPQDPEFPDDNIGKTDSELMPGKAGEELTRIKKRVLDTGIGVREVIKAELPHETRYYDLLVEPYYDQAGNVAGIGGAALDVTSAKKATAELEESRRQLGIALSAGRMGTWEWDVSSNKVSWSPSLEEIHGMAPGTFPGTFEAFLDDVHPEDVEKVKLAISSAMEKRGDHHIEYRLKPKNGKTTWVEGRGVVFVGQNGEVEKMLGVCIDVTERIHTQESAGEERRVLEAVSAAGMILASELDLETVVQKLTDVATEVSGAGFGAFFYNVVDERGETYQLYAMSGARREDFDKFSMPRNTAVFGPTFRGEGIVRSDDITKDPRYGKNKPYNGVPKGHLPVRSYLAVPVVSRTGEVIGGLFLGHPEVGVFQDRAVRTVSGIAAQAAISIDNARLYRALRESEDTYRTSFELAAAGKAQIDLRTGKYVRVNRKFSEMVGYTREQIAHMSVLDLTHPEDLEMQRDALEKFSRAEISEYSLQIRYAAKGGNAVWAHVSAGLVRDAEGKPWRAVAVITDINEKVALEEKLLQAQKMESIGRLAGGIAHDFNNLLTALIGYAELSESALPYDSPIRSNMQQIQKVGHRAADLTRQLLAFARKQIIEPRVLSANELVTSSVNMLRRLIGEHIEYSTTLAPNLKYIKVDRSQFEQVLLNLAVNARDAMPNGGRFTIETTNVEVTGPEGAAMNLQPGDYVLMTVRDTGTGMSDDVLQHIFEPFFTTKEFGKGTGLGLATCYGIVKQAGGHITATSVEGKGSSFMIYLPISQQELPETNARQFGGTVAGNETVLVVEDEVLLLQLAVETLRAKGYTVLAAESGADAITLAKNYSGKIDLLLADVVMPQMSGRQVAEAVTALRPEIRVLYISGYTGDAIIHHGVSEGELGFLSKPFTSAELMEKVREVLDAEDLTN